jgi:hypothetical protein
MQGELNLLGLLKAPDYVRGDVLLGFGDDEEKAVKAAIKWAWLQSPGEDDPGARRRPHRHQAAALREHLNGKKYLPPHKINAFEWIVGNRALSMTIERFRKVREEESALDLARAIVDGSVKAA